MADRDPLSRRQFTRIAAAASVGLGVLGLKDSVDGGQAAQRGSAPPAAVPRPDNLKSAFLMDLILETSPTINVGARTVVGVTGGTFEGPRLKGTVVSPGADWPMRINETLRILDVRTVLVTDDDQKIYTSYRGVLYTPPPGQGERYWRTTPIFETDSPKYAWLTRIVAVGVSFTVPQRVAYRIFEIL